MTFATSLNASLNDWLSNLATGRKEALKRGARRFASLVSPTADLETPRLPDGDGVAEHTMTSLSITTGLHRGASMELISPEYLIGSGDDCDVVLRDAAVCAHLCRLVRDWSGFCVRDLRTGTPQPVAPRKVTYKRGGAIEAGYELGGVEFTLRQHPLASRTVRSQETRKQAVSRAILAVALGGVVLAILAIAGAGAGQAVTKTPTASAKWISSGDQALAAQGFGSVHFGQDAHGEPQVSGLVTDPTERQRLQHWLRGSRYGNARLHVQLVSDLIEQTRRALADETLKISLRDARLDIEGRTSRLESKERIRALAEDLRGTISVEDRVQYLDPGDLAAPGPLPVTVRSVMVGNPSYFLTDDGTRYFVGGQLPDGAEVVAIDAQQIEFRWRGKGVTYKLK